MPSFIYSWATELRNTLNPTVVATTANVNFPAANLVDSNPGQPAKLSGLTGDWVIDFTVATRIDIIGLIQHNLTAGLANVRIQGNATNVWTTPTFSQIITIPAGTQDGHPKNPWLDLTALAGYSVSGFRYWRLVFGTSNAAAISVGELAMVGVKRTFSRGISWGSTRGRKHYGAYEPTDGGLNIGYGFGTRSRTISGQTEPNDTEARDSLVEWFDSARGNQRPFLVVPNTDENDCYFMKFREGEMGYTRDFANKNTFPFELEEAGLGVAP